MIIPELIIIIITLIVIIIINVHVSLINIHFYCGTISYKIYFNFFTSFQLLLMLISST